MYARNMSEQILQYLNSLAAISFFPLKGKRRRSDEARNAADASTSKKHAGDDKCHPKKGSQGKPIDLLANYFRLIRRPDWLLYKYHVTFEPEVLMPRVRNALIFQHKPKFGGYLFDGTQLFLTRRLDDHHLGLVSTSREDVEYRITLQFTIQIDMNGNESNQVFNLILRRAMQGLQLTLVQRNYYDPQAAIVENLRNYNIQLWPGYDTSVRQHEYDILLNVDVRNKVMRTDTVYQLLEEARGSNDFRSEFQRRVVGITVLTDFNNATYRIDDVDFDKTPRSTFPKNGQEVSFVDYYQQVRLIEPNQSVRNGFAYRSSSTCRNTGERSEILHNHFWCQERMRVQLEAGQMSPSYWFQSCVE